MLKKSSRRKSRRGVIVPSKNRAAVIVTLVVMCIVATTILAQVNSKKKGKEASGEYSLQSLGAANPSREMIYAGNRMVASEDGYSNSPAYKSFAGNGTGATPATITVTAPSGANWTATSNLSWVIITSGSSGTGNGTVNYSVAVNSGSTIRNATITVNNQAFTVYQGINFTDVASDHIFYEFIGRLAARGVTLGCASGTYCPLSTVSHGEMSAFVIRALGMTSPPAPPSQRFADVPSSYVFYSFIEQMGARGIWTGCPGGNYCPTSPVLREQMAAIMIRGRGEFNPPTPGTQRFTDVSPTNQYYNFIDRMAVLGITLGCIASPPQYCPTSSVTRGEMAAFLVKAFNL
jgi:hypothetical protein